VEDLPHDPRVVRAVTYYVFDDKIGKEIFDKILRASGQFIGIGRFRPRNCGYYGRFSVEAISWKDA